jgi:CIC family chloride channel protein
MLDVLQYPVMLLKKRLSDRSFIIVSSILVGLTSGLAAIVLKYTVHSMSKLVASAKSSDEYILIAFLPMSGILLAIFFTKFFLNGHLQKGSAEIVYTIVKRSSLINPREVYGHLFTSAFTVGLGGSLGLESPMVSTGSAIGSNYGKSYGLSYKERTVLLGCGAAAGIAAAFNSPIAGVLFAIEVLLTDVATTAFIPLIISAACGALLSKIILAEGVTLAFKLQQPFNYLNVPYYILLGIFCGLIALLYRKVFQGIEFQFERFKNIWLKVFIGGFILSVVILIFPPLFGEGYEGVRLLELKNPGRLLDGSIIANVVRSDAGMLAFIALLIPFKMIAAAITLGSGGNGGSFAPSLVIGSYLGFVFSRLINISGFAHLPVSNFTLVSMAGILSGIFYAPLTAIFLIAEITGGYGLIIPLMIVSSLSLVVAHLVNPLSMEANKLSMKLKSTVETRDKLLLSRLDLSALIETDFALVDSNATLKDLTRQIATSNRNLFPVVDKECKLVGIVSLDKIRKIIFDHSKYETLCVRDLMEKPKAIVDATENLYEVLAKFETTGQWSLPVIDNDCYVGFLSKSSILTRYRKELLDVT